MTRPRGLPILDETLLAAVSFAAEAGHWNSRNRLCKVRATPCSCSSAGIDCIGSQVGSQDGPHLGLGSLHVTFFPQIDADYPWILIFIISYDEKMGNFI